MSFDQATASAMGGASAGGLSLSPSTPAGTLEVAACGRLWLSFTSTANRRRSKGKEDVST